jgi:hypothetical protein
MHPSIVTGESKISRARSYYTALLKAVEFLMSASGSVNGLSSASNKTIIVHEKGVRA